MKVITFGRSPENDVVINDTQVSRHHLQIIQDDNDSFRLADFGSKNGTYVNGRRVSGEVTLSSNDIVRIGTTALAWKRYFTTHSAPPQQPLPQPPSPPPVYHIPIIPENININKNEKVEYSNILRKGDDFKVNFNRNMGDKIGSTVGNTVGCLISIVIIVVVIAIIALIAS
jgi:tetrahydromethanopterin S-methyltransferase subunit G